MHFERTTFSGGRRRWACLWIALNVAVVMGRETESGASETEPGAIRAYFAGQRMQVVTFLGYSGAGYEDPGAMLEHAARVLDRYDPNTTLVNCGATAEGIGAVYALAKRRRFRTTGIVSVQARHEGVALSPDVDTVFFVEDSTWGGFLPGTERLSPTSQAMVDNSDVLVAIGGGDVARDELIAARRQGKVVVFIPADLDHRRALEKARRKSLPPPSEFAGTAKEALQHAP